MLKRCRYHYARAKTLVRVMEILAEKYDLRHCVDEPKGWMVNQLELFCAQDSDEYWLSFRVSDYVAVAVGVDKDGIFIGYRPPIGKPDLKFDEFVRKNPQPVFKDDRQNDCWYSWETEPPKCVACLDDATKLAEKVAEKYEEMKGITIQYAAMSKQ